MGLQHWFGHRQESRVAIAPAVWEVDTAEFDLDAFPQGQLCDWSYDNFASLRSTIAKLNSEGKRAAIIDSDKCLDTPAWRLLTQSGSNWLVRPDTIEAALANAHLLLSSGEFSLIVIDGLSSDRLLPAQIERLQRLVPAHATLIFASSQANSHCA